MEISSKRHKCADDIKKGLLLNTGLKGKTLRTASNRVGAMTGIPNTGPQGKFPNIGSYSKITKKNS